jgi:hypothetical protein
LRDGPGALAACNESVFPQNTELLLHRFFGGNVAALARFLKINKYTILAWKAKTQRPTLLSLADPTALIRDDGFFLNFSPKLKSVKLEPTVVPALIRKVRDICDLTECPAGKPGCGDCSRLDLLTVAARGIKSSVAP